MTRDIQTLHAQLLNPQEKVSQALINNTQVCSVKFFEEMNLAIQVQFH